jgi:hypothetical protein
MTTTDPIPDKLNITQDDVVKVIKRIIKVDGLEAAREAFRQMNWFFSGLPGWAETTDAAYDIFATARRKEHQEQLAARLEEQRASAPNIVMLNNNESTGVGKVDQLNGFIENGAEVTHNKHN